MAPFFSLCFSLFISLLLVLWIICFHISCGVFTSFLSLTRYFFLSLLSSFVKYWMCCTHHSLLRLSCCVLYCKMPPVMGISCLFSSNSTKEWHKYQRTKKNIIEQHRIPNQPCAVCHIQTGKKKIFCVSVLLFCSVVTL